MSQPVGKINWQNLFQTILPIILQILGGLTPKPAATFDEHRDAIREQLQSKIDAGTIVVDIEKALAVVEAQWPHFLAIYQAFQQAFGG